MKQIIFLINEHNELQFFPEISSTMLKYAHISSSRLNIQSSFAPGITSTTDMNTEISTTDTNSYNTGKKL